MNSLVIAQAILRPNVLLLLRMNATNRVLGKWTIPGAVSIGAATVGVMMLPAGVTFVVAVAVACAWCSSLAADERS
jgi:hypothetical protein